MRNLTRRQFLAPGLSLPNSGGLDGRLCSLHSAGSRSRAGWNGAAQHLRHSLVILYRIGPYDLVGANLSQHDVGTRCASATA